MVRIVLSTLMLFAFLVVATTGQAHQAFEARDANADPVSLLPNAANGKVTTGIGPGDHNSEKRPLHCVQAVHCGTAILTVDYFLKPLAPARSVLPIIDWSTKEDSLEIDPPPPRRQPRPV